MATSPLHLPPGLKNMEHVVNRKVRGGKLSFFVWTPVHSAPVFNYSPSTGRVEVYALYGNVIDYNCPLNINQVY